MPFRSLALPALLVAALASTSPAQNCGNTSVGFTPLDELGPGLYQGHAGGLYPGGSNTPPPSHAARGLMAASQVQPLDAAGQPDPSGEIVLLSIGMSNARNHFQAFMGLSDADPERAAAVTLVQGAIGGQSAEQIADPGAAYWTMVDDRLAQAGVTAAQVQVLWMLEAHAGPSGAFPQDALHLQDDLTTIVRILGQRFPNARLAYLNSRIYAGYATSPLNPEPFAYQGAFAMKWLIEAQINGAPELNPDPLVGPVEAPWLAWGVYAWADGLVPRTDGLTWECADFQNDGTHPSAAGAAKMAALLHAFLRSDPSSAPWYLEAGASPTGIPYCFGDGSGAACPCGNTGASGHGCANAQRSGGARLVAFGTPRVAEDDLTLGLSGLPSPGTAVLYFQGTQALAGGQGVAFGDGLRCAGGAVERLGVTLAAPDGNLFPNPAASGRLSVLGELPAAGGTRYYSAWYRDTASFCTGATWNLSNGVEILWAP